MSGHKVAHRYAKSLMEEALRTKSEEKIKNDMALFSEACLDNRNLKLALENPIINYDKKLKILEAIFSSKVENLTLNFFGLVCRKGRARYLPLMATEFHSLFDDFKNINQANIVTAIKLDSGLRKDFIDLIEKIFGKKVDLTEEVEEEIIGGFIFKMNNKQIDESIRYKLKQLKLELIDKSYKAKL
jgi:F-type H+-transporting ATPase subunit delta